MQYVVAVFRVRSETMSYASILRSYGIPINIINTPRQINVSCGISVKFNEAYLSKAKNVMHRRRFDSFGGFYLMIHNGASVSIRPV